MRIAVIPARGGSKRIPRKNIRPFAGKPMIAYAIEAALRSGVCDEVIVSTDDMEIADVALTWGAKLPFMRPANLADDHTPTVRVIAHAIRALAERGWQLEDVCCIYPAVPLLRPTDLQQALAVLRTPGSRPYVFPVLPFPSPVQRALRRLPGGGSEPLYPEHVGTRTQDLEPAYYDAGQFYWGRAQAWLDGLPLHAHGNTIVLPHGQAIDIDTPADWDRAEALFRALTD
jgi:pseudaminic acid cytidylyltransferase